MSSVFQVTIVEGVSTRSRKRSLIASRLPRPPGASEDGVVAGYLSGDYVYGQEAR